MPCRRRSPTSNISPRELLYVYSFAANRGSSLLSEVIARARGRGVVVQVPPGPLFDALVESKSGRGEVFHPAATEIPPLMAAIERLPESARLKTLIWETHRGEELTEQGPDGKWKNSPGTRARAGRPTTADESIIRSAYLEIVDALQLLAPCFETGRSQWDALVHRRTEARLADPPRARIRHARDERERLGRF